ncbi:MAG: hypothetical protein KDE31_37940, partial [Caldilineaceae bacterium]|nr:hypothetical protein [Caldilineaceae bacterium]
VTFELFIEGEKTDAFHFEAGFISNHVGRYRYLWDGRNSQGQRLATGVYEYVVKLGVLYRAQYCYSLNGVFGNPPDCQNGATGVFVEGIDEVFFEGRVKLESASDSPYGNGWLIQGQQRLYADGTGRLMISDGKRVDEYATLNLFGGDQPAADILKQSQYQRLQSHALVLPSSPETTEISTAAETTEKAPPVQPSNISEDDGSEAPAAYTETRLAAQVSVCGEIAANTTWTVSNSPYTLTCNVTVAAAATLTVEPGVVVKAGSLDELIIRGGLVAQGTSAQPIVFTSIKDDTHGGDTNGDGNASVPAARDWDGITFEPGSRSAGLSHVILAYSTNGAVYNALGTATDLTFTGNFFQNNDRRSVYLELADAAGQITASGNTAANNGLNAIVIDGTVAGALNINWQ